MPHLNDYIWAMHIKDSDLQKALNTAISMAWAKPDPIQWFTDIKDNHMDPQIESWFMTYFHQHIQAMIEICDSALDSDDRFIEKKKHWKLCSP